MAVTSSSPGITALSDASTTAFRGKPATANASDWQTTTFASRSTAPEASSRRRTTGVNAVPSRFMKAAIARRDTGSSGQYRPVPQPSVTARFLSHSTFGQNALPLSTSLKPAHGAAPATGTALAKATAASARRKPRRLGLRVEGCMSVVPIEDHHANCAPAVVEREPEVGGQRPKLHGECVHGKVGRDVEGPGRTNRRLLTRQQRHGRRCPLGEIAEPLRSRDAHVDLPLREEGSEEAKIGRA